MCILHLFRKKIEEYIYIHVRLLSLGVCSLKILPKFKLKESVIDEIDNYTIKQLKLKLYLVLLAFFTSDIFTSEIFTSDIISSDIFTSEIFTSDIISSDIFTSDIFT